MLVTITNHSNIPYEVILNSKVPVIDTRNVFKNNSDKQIQRLGEG